VSQTLAVLGGGGGLGSSQKLKIAIARLTNTAAETTYTLTAASVGMAEMIVVPIDESAAAAIRANPTAGSGGMFTSVALSFTAGDELTFLCVGQ
jgi:hypothetical protein